MTVRSMAAVTALAIAALAAPSAAPARTKVVDMGLPVSAQRGFNAKLGADVNDFFPHTVTIDAGDAVRFVPTEFHSVDLPAKGDGPLDLFGPTGDKVAGVTDAAGAAFWFNGQDQLSFAPRLVAPTSGRRRYDGTARVTSGLPLANKPRPLTVRFPDAGAYRYYCNVHAGMTGLVRVLPKGRAVPSAARDARALRAQLARDRATAGRLAAVKPPAGVLDVGSGGEGGVEVYAMFPRRITVPVGTTLKLRMSPGSYDIHTASFGPDDPGTPNPQGYLGTLVKSFRTGPVFDPRGVYPSERPGTTGTLTAATHGNGFWNTGVMDNGAATGLPSSGSVTFGAAGTYRYYCLIHPFMKGSVTVR